MTAFREGKLVVTVGERIAHLRKEQSLSQVQLAKLLEVTRQAVSKWENDLTAPDTINLIRLADVLSTDTEYLATGNHSRVKSVPEVVTIVKPVEKFIEVEKVVEKPVYIEKIVEVEKPVEIVTEQTRVKKVFRTKYVRNPLEFIIIGTGAFLIGVLVGLLL